MKLIIAGPRKTNIDVADIQSEIVRLRLKPFEIVSGTATGVDRCGEWWAAVHGLPVKRFPAEWDKWGKAAGPKRNLQMAEYADALLAFWDSKSRGTQNMIETMLRLKKSTYIKYIEEVANVH